MSVLRPLAALAAAIVVLVLASAVLGLPAALGSPAAIVTAAICLIVVAAIVALGGRETGPRTPYW
ncbi:hypothetical protein [Halopenitus persicus]|uniref:hypothetical protein n=1 Tax=Halopenitus persicus TaxID=1048396 RepID=UPI000BBB4B91|nr:hypothetical protein [Halopenitus persicus]